MSFINRNVKTIGFICFILSGFSLYGQNANGYIEGKVNYVSSQNVYVQFVNTVGIEIGDTLFSLKNDTYKPLLIVINKSSISCIGAIIGADIPAVSTQLYARKRVETVPVEVAARKSKEGIPVNELAVKDAINEKQSTGNGSSFHGRVSLSGFVNNTSDSTLNSTFRFNLSMNAHHIANSNFSAECDLSLTNRTSYRPFVNLSSVDSMKLINYNDRVRSFIETSGIAGFLLD